MNRDTAAAALFAGMIVTGSVLYCRSVVRDDYLLYVDLGAVSFDSAIGTVTLRPATGYYGFNTTGLPEDHPARQREASKALFMYVEGTQEFSHELSVNFRKVTGGRFQLERCPMSARGGSDTAYAIISAGANHDAYTACRDRLSEGKKVRDDELYLGYFKENYFRKEGNPDYQEMVRILCDLLEVDPIARRQVLLTLQVRDNKQRLGRTFGPAVRHLQSLVSSTTTRP